MWRSIVRPFYRNPRLFSSIVRITGMTPVNMRIYEIAFIHKSASVILPDGNLINNERLEYLGDAILDAVVADFLFRNYADEDEGFLTKMRSKLVKRKQLNLLAIRLGIDKLMTSQTGTGNPTKNLYGNAFEALVGAVYIDKGYKKTFKFIERIIRRYVRIENLIKSDSDYKSQLIEWAQKNRKEIIFESHEIQKGEQKIPSFVTHVRILENMLGKGIGNSKKESEQKAAKSALEHISVE